MQGQFPLSKQFLICRVAFLKQYNIGSRQYLLLNVNHRRSFQNANRAPSNEGLLPWSIHHSLQSRFLSSFRHKLPDATFKTPKIRLTPVRPKFRKRPTTSEEDDDEKEGLQHSTPRHLASIEQLEEELRWIAHNSPHPPAVHHILKILIETRGVKPTSAHYEALILANCSASHGSCENVEAILQEMERENIPMGAPVYTALLKVLTIHPHPYLRSTILDQLARQWIPLSPETIHYIAAGAIREGQTELAWLEIEKMRQERIPVEPWLYVILLRSMCDQEDFEGVLRLIYDLIDFSIELPMTVWSYILEKAGQHQNYDVTSWVWQEMVEPMYITPTLQNCSDVLSLAASEGQPWLARSVMIVLKDQYNVSDEHQKLFDETCKVDDESRSDDKVRSKNLFRFFSKEQGLENARFDPRKALTMRRRP